MYVVSVTSQHSTIIVVVRQQASKVKVIARHPATHARIIDADFNGVIDLDARKARLLAVGAASIVFPDGIIPT